MTQNIGKSIYKRVIKTDFNVKFCELETKNLLFKLFYLSQTLVRLRRLCAEKNSKSKEVTGGNTMLQVYWNIYLEWRLCSCLSVS